MSNLLKYKNYVGKVEFDADDSILVGKILFITDLVTFIAKDAGSIQAEFEEAVDDYLEMCAEIGKDPEKPMSGSFNVRITPEMHKKLAIQSHREDVSINEIVKRSIEKELVNCNDLISNVDAKIASVEAVAEQQSSDIATIQYEIVAMKETVLEIDKRTWESSVREPSFKGGSAQILSFNTGI